MQEKLHRPMVSQLAIAFKFVTKRWSFFTFLAMSLGLMVIEASRPDLSADVRALSMDKLIPVAEVASRPFEVMEHGYEIVHHFAFIRDENERLRLENTRLKNMALTASYVQAENQQLRQLLRIPSEVKPHYVSAKVIGSTTGSWLKSALVNVGKRNGVEVGQVVINEYGIVGRIIEVGNNTARILLIHDVQSRVPVMSSRSQERAIVSGMDSDNLRLIFVPDETHIRPGEILYSSGDGRYFPQGLMVGKVGKRINNEFLVTPSVKRHQLKYVNIVKYDPEALQPFEPSINDALPVVQPVKPTQSAKEPVKEPKTNTATAKPAGVEALKTIQDDDLVSKPANSKAEENQTAKKDIIRNSPKVSEPLEKPLKHLEPQPQPQQAQPQPQPAATVNTVPSDVPVYSVSPSGVGGR